jgi:hypothetical protein
MFAREHAIGSHRLAVARFWARNATVRPIARAPGNDDDDQGRTNSRTTTTSDPSELLCIYLNRQSRG